MSFFARLPVIALREINAVRRQPGEAAKRWFTSETMDLIAWFDDDGHITNFWFCYDKGRGHGEKAVIWRIGQALAHAAVDDGENDGPLTRKAAPIAYALGPRPERDLGRLFADASQAVPAEIRDFVLSRLEQAIAA